MTVRLSTSSVKVAYAVRALLRVMVALAVLLASPFDLAAGEAIISGDNVLDQSLHRINSRFRDNTSPLVSALAREYLLPENHIRNLMVGQHFTPADLFLMVAIADLSGQPVTLVSRAYLEHRTAGWPYVLEQLNIEPGSSDIEQLVEDAALYD